MLYLISTPLLQHKGKQKSVLLTPECRSTPIMSHRDFMRISFEMHIISWRLFFWKKDPLCPQIWNSLDMGKEPLKTELYHSALALLQQGKKNRFTEQETLLCRRALWKINMNTDWFLGVQGLEEVILSPPTSPFFPLLHETTHLALKKSKTFLWFLLVLVFFKIAWMLQCWDLEWQMSLN